jgi:hypothetical protein
MMQRILRPQEYGQEVTGAVLLERALPRVEEMRVKRI